MQYKIQTLVFPNCGEHQRCRELFYRGDKGILDEKEQRLTLGFAQYVDLLTYFNACSWQKWQKYTAAKKLTLHLVFKGDARVKAIGTHKDSLTVSTRIFEQIDFYHEDYQEAIYEFPVNDEQMVGVEILALSPELEIKSGYYTVEIPRDSLNTVRLSIATTTCNKEEFIKKNVSLIKHEIIDSDNEIAENLFLNVIDNGRTLKPEEIDSKNIKLHTNINAGGAGGFARGMMESIQQNPEATHVLLMDDDVLVLPESIKRTYNLLRLMKPEYHDYFVSGAMLYYEDPAIQHEDLGMVDNEGMLKPVKEEFDHSLLEDNLSNEAGVAACTSKYAAWWYCCIPMSQIKKNGLPLPIFIRIDDVEYSLRCKAQMITMNGICVWHMGFATKYNGVFDKYQHFRNLLIIQATTNVIPDKDIIGLWYNAFRREMLQFNYRAVELILKALEDYLKGPAYIMNTDGEKILQENRKLDNTPRPLAEVREGLDITMTPQEANTVKPLSIQNQIFLKLTWNGHKFTPKRFNRAGLASVGYGGFAFQPERIARHTEVLAINPFNNTGVLYTRDKQKFRELMRKYKKLMKEYKKRGTEIREAYSGVREEITSEEFWRKYLKLDTE